jgi:hypothetical protein
VLHRREYGLKRRKLAEDVLERSPTRISNQAGCSLRFESADNGKRN